MNLLGRRFSMLNALLSLLAAPASSSRGRGSGRRSARPRPSGRPSGRWAWLAVAVLGAVAGCGGPAAPAPTPVAEAAARVPADWEFPLGEGAPAHGARAMVASDDSIATEVALDVLRRGGNAVDAAVALAFTLAVVYPEAGNIGGGGFMVTRQADGTVAALDFREEAPGGATADMYLDERGELTDRSVTGHLAAGVPGAVHGLWTAHQRFGSRPWRELVEPAIGLAERGFPVNARFERVLEAESDRLSRFEGSRELWLPGGAPPTAGSTFRNPDMAATLRRIAEGGPAGFYRGETADLIVAEMQRGGGLITHADLAAYEAKWREPVVFEYRGLQVASMPPPSSGGLTLALIANILEGWDLAELGWHTPGTLHLQAEAMRRAFADRNHYLGDSDFVDVRRGQFLSEEYAERQRATIARERATPSSSVEAGLGRAGGAGDDGGEGTHTTHFSIVDAGGGAVALTTTVNFLYGSAVTVSGAGFVLNDEMDDFTAKPGEPNAYGLVQGEANAIAPGKRMLSAMTPTVVSDDRGTLLVTGARGGPRIITAAWQVLSNVADHGFPIDAAVRAPRIHHQHLPDILYHERDGITEELAAALRERGHRVEPRGGIGIAPSILRREDGWAGVGDPRSGGFARGF